MTGTSMALMGLLLLVGGCPMRSEERRLAMGGVHALEAAEPCHLTQVEPASALEDLAWKDALVVRARSEGRAVLACGSHRTQLQIVKPARLDLVLVDDYVKVGQRFQVRAVPRDRDGRSTASFTPCENSSSPPGRWPSPRRPNRPRSSSSATATSA